MFIPPNPDRIPQIWGIWSGVHSEQKSVPAGPHSWVEDGILTRCGKCGVGVYVGTADDQRTLSRLAGVLCSDVLAMEVMGS
jgi:hypothetical protein